jgi:hypothetical protein
MPGVSGRTSARARSVFDRGATADAIPCNAADEDGQGGLIQPEGDEPTAGMTVKQFDSPDETRTPEQTEDRIAADRLVAQKCRADRRRARAGVAGDH